MRYRFDWDPVKERKNIRKHNVTFALAATVFRDPNQLSIYDEGHSEDEYRWVTIGITARGGLLVVAHTFEQIEPSLRSIRIISARKAVKKEVEQYRKGNL